MPIPFLFGAAAVIAGGYGLKKGVDAINDMDTAKTYTSRAKKIAGQTDTMIKNAQASTKLSLEALGKVKIDILSTS